MRLIPPTLFGFMTTVALMFAVATSGFAHTRFSSKLSPELVEFVELGGSLADLCGGPFEEGGTPGQGCEACRLMEAGVLPDSGHGRPVIVTMQTRKLSFVAKRIHHAHPLDSARLTRAPPQA
jgi:hypothetical protein